MSADFVKLYPGFFLGTIARETAETRLCFVAMLSLADQNGVVRITPDALARYVNVDLDEAELALERLAAPDEDSTSPELDGCRIVPWGDGANTWRLVNYEKYLKKSREEERKDYKREWDRQNADQRHKSGSKRKNPTKPDKPDPENESENESKSKAKGNKSIVVLDEIPEVLQNSSFLNAWDEWIAYRKSKKKPLSDAAKTKQLKLLAQYPSQAVDMIEASIRNDWQGIFEPKTRNGKPNKTTARSVQDQLGRMGITEEDLKGA